MSKWVVRACLLLMAYVFALLIVFQSKDEFASQVEPEVRLQWARRYFEGEAYGMIYRSADPNEVEWFEARILDETAKHPVELSFSPKPILLVSRSKDFQWLKVSHNHLKDPCLGVGIWSRPSRGGRIKEIACTIRMPCDVNTTANGKLE